MPRRKGGRSCDRRHGGRRRTSSQSSVEIQVTSDETIITTTTTSTTALASTSQGTLVPTTLVQPRIELLNLLKTVGAKGQETSQGEFFSFQQLCSYFREYLKKHELWDRYNPHIIHCEKDPLGQVFNVPSFTFWDTRQLLAKNLVDHGTTALPRELPAETQSVAEKVEQLDNRPQNDENILLPKDSQTGHEDDVITTTVPTPPEQITEPPGVQQLQAAPHPVAAQAMSRPVVDENGNQTNVDTTEGANCGTSSKSGCADTTEVASKGAGRKGTKRRRGDRSPPSLLSEDKPPEGEYSKESEKVKDGEKRTRTRGNSISLVVSNGSLGIHNTYEWWIPMVTQAESDDSEIYSVQSKETVIVKSSSDDIWFLDEEDVESDQDPPFMEEYEVVSEHSSPSNSLSDQTDTSDPGIKQEQFVLVCAESDVEFWADSESSESDESTDAELSEEDKWRCNTCNSLNSPLHRHCDFCWQVRADWLPELPRNMIRTRCRPQWQTRKVPRTRTYRQSMSAPIASGHTSSSDHEGCDKIDSARQLQLSGSVSKGDGSVTQDFKGLTTSTPLCSRAATKNRNPSTTAVRPQEPQSNESDVFNVSSGEDECDGVKSTVTPTVNISPLGGASGDADCPAAPTDHQSEESNIATADDSSITKSITDVAKQPASTPISSISRWPSEQQSDERECLPLSLDSGVETETMPFHSQESLTSVYMSGSQDSGVASQSLPSSHRAHSSDATPYGSVSSTSSTTTGILRRNSAPNLSSSCTGSSTLDKELTPNYDPSREAPTASSPEFSSSSAAQMVRDRNMEDVALTRACLANFQMSGKPGELYGAESLVSKDIQAPCLSEDPLVGQGQPVPLRRVKSEPPGQVSPVKHDASSMCMLCLSRPKDASIVHGKTGHQVCCYTCAKRLRRRGKPCPVCRRPIKMVIKNYFE